MTVIGFNLESNIIDPLNRREGFGIIKVVDGRIEKIEISGPLKDGSPYLMPGFIDAHVHVESSMLTPPAFAALAVKFGTVATISDPHEIANVCGLEGVRYMIALGKKSGFNFYFGAPSCVPATPFETAGAALPLSDIRELFHQRDSIYLAEMMNYPAVLNKDPLVIDKIELAKEYLLPVDGHAPGLIGRDAKAYAASGITTDHECTTLEEALDKLSFGMQILIREGSAAKNFNALHHLISSHSSQVMFCSDDKHPDDLVRGHIDQLVIRSIQNGHSLFDVLQAACVNPVKHYRIDTGLLQPGDLADMILVEDLQSFKILTTWIAGKKVFDGVKVDLPAITISIINSFKIKTIESHTLRLVLKSSNANIIVAHEGSLVTSHEKHLMEAGNFEGDIDRDILKIVVVNRYFDSQPSIALIKGFGLKRGAIASSVAHDSHNIIAVGSNDEDLTACINEVIINKGGIAAVVGTEHSILPLPIAGLMSPENGETVAAKYEALNKFVRQKLQSNLEAPFMTLSFMALLVIPTLKLSDKGLFDGARFEFIELQ